MTARVLLFGGSGFVGRHVGAALAPLATLVRPRRDDCDLVTTPVAGLAALIRDVRPTAVVNCAGRVTGSAEEMRRVHAGVTATLIDAVAVAAPGARIIRIGSAAEYGPVGPGHRVRESDPAAPVSGYGAGQLAATRLVQDAVAAGRADAVVLRVFNLVGPGLPVGHALGRAAVLLRAAVEGGQERIEMGLLDTYRDFVDVRDVARAVRIATFAPAVSAPVINVASGRAASTRRVIHRLARIAGFTGTVAAGPLSAEAAGSVRVPWMCADVSRAADVLGWHPVRDLSDSLRDLWAEPDPVAWPVGLHAAR